MAITGTLKGRALIRKQKSYYTAEQALQYLQRVGWVEGNYSVQDIENGRFPANLEHLEIIVRRHYISFTNDTTLMHYSAEHFLDVTPEFTFKRLVTDRKGGTYCYGHHNLMLGVLRALGYRSYSGIARMNFGIFTGGEDNYQAYGHMILFVQLGDDQGTDPTHTWIVDCAPGSPVPMRPIPLSDDPANVIPNANPGELNRLTRGFSPACSLVAPGPDSPYSAEQAAGVADAHALWQMEFRGTAGKMSKFIIVYQFSEQEFTWMDYNVQHYAKMHKPFEDVFSDDIIAARFVLSDKEPEKPVTERPLEKYTLYRGVFKRRLGDEVLEMIECKSEEERVAVLRKYFEVTIKDEDIKHIEDTEASWEKKKEVPPEVKDIL